MFLLSNASCCPCYLLAGAVCFGLGFRQLDYFDAFILMASVIIVASGFSIFIFIKGQASLLCGGGEAMTAEKANQTLQVPEPKDEIIEEVEA